MSSITKTNVYCMQKPNLKGVHSPTPTSALVNRRVLLETLQPSTKGLLCLFKSERFKASFQEAVHRVLLRDRVKRQLVIVTKLLTLAPTDPNIVTKC